MGALIGLVFGLGVTLVVSGLTAPDSSANTRPRRPGWLRDLIARSGTEGLRPVHVVLSCLAIFLVVALAGYAATGVTSVAAVVAALVSTIPLAVLQGRATRRRREFAEAWPDAIDHLASAVRAGLSLPEALIGLGDRGPTELQPAFAQFRRDYQSSGRFADCLDLLKERLADPTGDRVVEALRIAREVGGGDLGRMLRSLSGFLREDQRTRGELESRQSWTISGARLAVAAPWIVLLMLGLQGDGIDAFARPTGVVILASGAGLCVLAYRLMMRIGRLPEERRILR